jgi:hypothetical protein
MVPACMMFSRQQFIHFVQEAMSFLTFYEFPFNAKLKMNEY